MELRYEEWLPSSPELSKIITAFWRVSGDGANFPASSVLPDGQVELVLNLGQPVRLDGPAYRGNQPDRAVVGLLSKSFRLEYSGLVNTCGIRFHAARGAGFLGKLGSELAEKILPLSDVCPRLDCALSRLFQDQTSAEAGDFRASLEQVLLHQLPSAAAPDTAVVAMVDRLTGCDAMPLILELARELEISSRQLQRRFLAAVGVPPKRFLRILRFARVWQLASMRPRETWADLAAQNGYADQAHLVREFRSFGAEPPTRVFTSEWYGVTQLSRVSGHARGVRSVQDSVFKSEI